VAFAQRLGELGYVNGKNVSIEFRSAEGKPERFPGLLAELVRLNVDVILAVGPEGSLRAAKEATTTIPIVAVAIDYDPIARGYVAGLARPGGNITGVFLRQPELTAKRVELLREVVPKVRRMAIFWDAFSADQLGEAEAVARSLGIQLQRFEFRDPPYSFDVPMREAARQHRGCAAGSGLPGFLSATSGAGPARDQESPPRHLSLPRGGGGGSAHGVWCRPRRHDAARRRVRGQNLEGNEAG